MIGEAYQLRETRHTAVSFLSYNGVPLEAISDLTRHKDSTVTRKIYRHVLADEGVSTALAWDGPGGGGSTTDGPAAESGPHLAPAGAVPQTCTPAGGTPPLSCGDAAMVHTGCRVARRSRRMRGVPGVAPRACTAITAATA